MNVECYGVHAAPGGVAFLLQEGPPQTALPVPVPSPFRPPHRLLQCPHKVDLLRRAEEPVGVSEDPLWRAMRPDPGRRDCFLIVDRDGDLLPLILGLQRLGSPTGYANHFALWERSPSTQTRMLTVTNVTTLVIHGLTHTNLSQMLRYLNLPRRRRLLFVADAPLPAEAGVQVIETTLTPSVLELPLEEIGAGVLYRRMRQ